MGFSSQSETDLCRDLLENVVKPLPVIDIHTHIRPAKCAAEDMGEIVFYHYILTALESAGVSRETIEQAKSAVERIAIIVSCQKLIANTATYWCLRRVLKNYGIDPEAPLTAGLLNEASRKVLETSSSVSWPKTILAERNNIRKTFLTLNITEPMPSFDNGLFAGALRLDELLTDLSPETLRKFESLSEGSLGDLKSFERAIGERLEDFARCGGVAITAGMAPDEEYAWAAAETERLYERTLQGEPLTAAERAALHSRLLRTFVSLAQEIRLPVQLMLGVRRPLPGMTAVPVLREDLAVRYAGLFNQFGKARFDLILASAGHSQEFIALAQNYANVSLAGHWWFAFSPPYIRAMLIERLLALPVVKLHGFFSDAYNVEWSSGKLALFRRELARALAELIISGYLSESQAPEVARALLHENPASFYSIPDSGYSRQNAACARPALG